MHCRARCTIPGPQFDPRTIDSQSPLVHGLQLGHRCISQVSDDARSPSQPGSPNLPPLKQKRGKDHHQRCLPVVRQTRSYVCFLLSFWFRVQLFIVNCQEVKTIEKTLKTRTYTNTRSPSNSPTTRWRARAKRCPGAKAGGGARWGVFRRTTAQTVLSTSRKARSSPSALSIAASDRAFTVRCPFRPNGTGLFIAILFLRKKNVNTIGKLIP